MKHHVAALGTFLLAIPAAAQPIIVPLQPQRQAEPPPPPPSPAPVAPPQAATERPASQGEVGSVPGTGPASQTGAGGDPSPRTAPE